MNLLAGVSRWMLLLFLLLQVADLVTTAIGGLQYEGNPLMTAVWSRYGFLPIIMVKLLVCGFAYLVAKVVSHLYPLMATGFLAVIDLWYLVILVNNLHTLAVLGT